MSLKEFFSFSWLRNLFTSSRMKWIREQLPTAIAAAELVTNVDWNQDGQVAGREKLSLLLNLAPPAARAWLAERGLYTADGTLFKVNWNAVEHMITPHLKQTIVIVGLVTKLVGLGIPIPNWGLIETVCQLAYEKLQSATKT